jgi:hypothetical protein
MQADLRTKRLAVLAARDAGKSTREAARKYGVTEARCDASLARSSTLLGEASADLTDC